MTMNKIIIAISILLATAPLHGIASTALLVESGQPRAEIVIAEQPARMTRLAAQELQTYIEKLSGATLPIVTEPSGEAARIYVGISPHTEALGLDTEGLKYGAYRRASGPNWLALLGPDEDFEPVEPWGRSRDAQERLRMNRAWDEVTGDHFWNPFHSLYMWYNPEFDFWEFDDRGTLHAVYDFLHDLGVRWYMPGELGEIVPEMMDIPLPTENTVVRPDYAVRRLSWFYQFLPVAAEDALWRLRLRLHAGHDVIGITQTVHGMKYVLMRDEMKERHPEFYALRGGERATGHQGGQGAPCLSSEDLFEKHVAYARAVFDHFDEPMLSIDLVDGFGGVNCECSDCRAQLTPERGWLGSMSDLVFGYLNRVAWALYESHPDRQVSGITYGAYTLPPERVEQMAPNFVLCAIPQRMSFHQPAARAQFENQLEDWREKLTSDRIFVFSNILFNWRGRGDTGPLLPVYVHRALAEHLRDMKGISGGEQIECYEHAPGGEFDWNAQAVAHLALYTYSRAWWDVEMDLDAMLDEYYGLFYGPAADEMRAFIEYCEENWPRMRTEVEPIDRAFELIAKAQAAADPASVYGRRIGLVADYLELARPLREQLSREREGPEIRLPVRPAEQLVIDGRLDDAFWEGVPEIALVDRQTGDPARVPTTVRFAWADNDTLLIGVRCEEPDMAGLLDTADGAAGIFNGDNIDLLLETPAHRYYQITVSPSGALLDMDRSRGFHTHWSSQAVIATHQGEDYWSVEIQLPPAGEDAAEMDPDTGIAGIMPNERAPWYFNLGRARPRAGEAEVTVVAPTGREHFHDRFKFGRLVVEER